MYLNRYLIDFLTSPLFSIPCLYVTFSHTLNFLIFLSNKDLYVKYQKFSHHTELQIKSHHAHALLLDAVINNVRYIYLSI